VVVLTETFEKVGAPLTYDVVGEDDVENQYVSQDAGNNKINVDKPGGALSSFTLRERCTCTVHQAVNHQRRFSSLGNAAHRHMRQRPKQDSPSLIFWLLG
jgi:hypothetical protein